MNNLFNTIEIIPVNGRILFPKEYTDKIDTIEVGATRFTSEMAREAAVQDSITNGVIDRAPSQNAVFDALALKADDLTLRSDLAGNGGAALVGYKQAGVGAIQRTARDKFQESISAKDFGAIGDGVTDDTLAIQNWVNALVSTGYKGYLPSTSQSYRTTGTITISGGIQIEGDFCEPLIGTMSTTGASVRGRGSWLYFDHAGVGLNIDGGASGRSGILLQEIGTIRNQPLPSGGAYTPGVFDYDIVANTADVTIKDCVLLNPTKGVSHVDGGYGRLSIDGLRGQPLQIGISVEQSFDTGRIRDVHFWPFWSSNAEVRNYMRTSASAFELARWDNPVLDNCFSLGYAFFVKLVQNASGHVNKLVMTNCDADVGGGMLFIDAAVNGATVFMSNCRTTGASSGAPANFSNVQINGSNNQLSITNCELRWPQGNCIRVQGSGNKVQASNITIGAWNQSASTYKAIDAATTENSILVHNRPIISEAGVSGALIYNEVAGALVNAPVSTGVTSITTDGSGFATIPHNGGTTPRKIVLSVQGSVPYFVQPTGSMSSTGFDVQVRTSSGSVAASATLTVHWRLDF